MKPLVNLTGLLAALDKSLAANIVDALKAANLVPDALKVKRVEVEVKADEVNDAERSIKAYLSTRHVDRDDEIVMPSGIDTSQFKQNPVILEGHDYRRSQVGRAETWEKDDMGLRAVVKFAPREALGADRPDYFLLSKFMPLTFSIGFIPLDVIREDHEKWESTVTKLSAEWPELRRESKRLKAIHRKVMMLEASVTPMPANVFARQSKMIEDAIAAGKITEADVKIIRKSFTMPDGLGLSEQEKAITEYLSLMDGSVPWPSQKPYPTEHAARLESPDKYDEVRRQNDKFGAGIHAIWGIIKGPPRKVELQAIRFAKDKFSVADARAWLKEHDYKPLAFEPAEDGKARLIPVAQPWEPPRAKLIRSGVEAGVELEALIGRIIENQLDLLRGGI